MGGLPNDVRTALVQSDTKETELLSSLLLKKKTGRQSNMKYSTIPA